MRIIFRYLLVWRIVTTSCGARSPKRSRSARCQHLHYLVTRCSTTRYDCGTRPALPVIATGRAARRLRSEVASGALTGAPLRREPDTYPRGELWLTLSGA